MKQSFILLSILLTSQTLANFSGTWVGTATTKDSNGNVENCDPFEYAVDQKSDTIEIDFSGTECGQTEWTSGSILLEIRNTDELWYSGKKVGTIGNIKIFTSISYPIGTGTVVSSWMAELITAKTATFSQYVTDGSDSIELSGTLKKN